MSDQLRMIVAAGILVYAFGGLGSLNPSAPVEPYTGSLRELHQASREMSKEDRASLSEALDKAADALSADSRNIVDTTGKAQDFFLAVLEFSYVGMGKPTAKYPSVASGVSEAMKAAVGDEDKALDAAAKAEVIRALREVSKATR